MVTNPIALVTCYFQKNYGSQLQAFATQMMFDKLKIKNETIRIDGLHKEINSAKYKYFITKIFDINVLSDKLGYIKYSLASRLKNKKFKEKIEIRNNKFYDFSNSKFNLSDRFNSKKELTSRANRYSCFVVGSDQLWLPSNIEGDYYTLNFVPLEIPKISYSTSFGISSLPKKQSEKANKFLKRFDFLSVREVSGKKIIKKLINKEASIVCDPTLMISTEEWNNLLDKRRFYKEKYILCYFLGDNPSQRDIALKLKTETKYKIVQLQHLDKYIKSDEGFPDYAPYDVDPFAFIQLIRDAEYVLTDSFHCSVFSILFKKNFFTFRRYKHDKENSTNSRIYSLLNILNAKDRLCEDTVDIKEMLSREIQYTEIYSNLEKIKEKSNEYILNIINELHL